MKDILKIMRFDFLTAAPASHAATEYILGAFMLIVAVCFPLFVFPAASVMYMFMAGPLIVPLQGYSEKNGFNKLYGILPVRRKNITRARFLYIFLTHFAMEIAALIILVISEYAKLFEIVSFMGKDSIFTDIGKLPEMAAIVIAWFAFLCLTYAFMEMYGQIHGRQNEMKVLFIIIIAVCVIVLGGVFILGQLGYPEIKLGLPVWASAVIVNFAVLGLCILFGEITAAKLAKREL